MPTLTLSKTYNDFQLLSATDLSVWLDDLTLFVNTTKLDDSNIQTEGLTSDIIADTSVTTAKLAANVVTTAKIASDAITAIKIAAGAVTTAKIADSAVTTAKLAASSINTEHLNASSITSSKIVTEAVTYVKRASLNTASSNSCGAYTLSSAGTNSPTTVTNLSVAITLTGSRPVFVGLMPVSTTASDPSIIGTFDGAVLNTVAAADIRVGFYYDGNLIGGSQIYGQSTLPTTYGYDTGYLPAYHYHSTGVPSTFLIHNASPVNNSVPPASGSHTYSVKVSNTLTGSSIDVRHFKLVVYEL